jgi:DNA-binding winged helix-turn-helix (wHTH) protein
MASAGASGKIRFGPFEADLATGELRKLGQRIRLQEQPFQLLAALLEKPGEVVTREELRRRIWSDETFVDFDNSLNKAVNKVREVLGDSSRNRGTSKRCRNGLPVH